MKLIRIVVAGLCLLVASNTAFSQKSFTLPPYEKTVLENGLTVYFLEQHEVPMINVSAIIPAGAIDDGNQSGLASLTALALRHGSKNMSKAKIDEELDFVGASLSTYADKEYASLKAQFAAANQQEVLKIVKEVLVNPVFNPAEFAKEKQRKLVALEQAKESPGRVIGNYFDMLYYGSNAYANPAAGHSTTVAKLTVADVKNFYNKHYLPNGSSLAIAGDFNTSQMKALITSLFGDWKKGELKKVEPQPVAPPGAASVLLVNKNDATETTFYIGGPGISFNNPDKVAINLINTFFGGRFTSWLNDELRVNTGLTYGARSGFVPFKNAGAFRISTFTANKNTETAIDKALEVLNRLHEKGVDEKTLTSAKNYVKGQFPPDFETASQLADLLNEMFWYGFDESYINEFEKNIDNLSVKEANNIIAKYFPKNNLQFVLIGKAADIRKIAEKYGQVKEVQLKEDVMKL